VFRDWFLNIPHFPNFSVNVWDFAWKLVGMVWTVGRCLLWKKLIIIMLVFFIKWLNWFAVKMRVLLVGSLYSPYHYDDLPMNYFGKFLFNSLQKSNSFVKFLLFWICNCNGLLDFNDHKSLIPLTCRLIKSHYHCHYYYHYYYYN